MRVVDVAAGEWGAVVPAVVALLAGAAGILAVEWVVGLGAHALQRSVDWPVFRWIQAHQSPSWTDVWWKLTQIGSPTVTQWLVIAGAIVLTLLWRKQAWWLPVAALVIGYGLEKYGQIVLQLVVHRGHPPTTLGTFPSGGCARVLVVYGLVAFFVARWYRGGRSRRAWTLAAGLVGLAITVQAYARLNNLEHWFTDVLGGTLYGCLLLFLVSACAELVLRGRAVRPSHRPMPVAAEAVDAAGGSGWRAERGPSKRFAAGPQD